MHKLTKAFTQLDPTPHKYEEEIQGIFTEVDGEAGAAIKEARAAGLSWSAIIGLLIQYGPQFAAMLQTILALIKNPPKPPAPPEVKERLLRHAPAAHSGPVPDLD